tara:strand:- start:1648 stop:2064 length:417 start_codon:yes stop_codon:yes gene_type:complete
MANTKPIGVAYSDQDISGADTLLSSSKLGYTPAAQGTVTQATSKATGVTLNKSAGRITMAADALANGVAVSFTLTNSFISTNDVLILCVSAGAVADPVAYTVYTSSLAAGSAVVTLRNLSATSRSEAVVVNFALIHCD